LVQAVAIAGTNSKTGRKKALSSRSLSRFAHIRLCRSGDSDENDGSLEFSQVVCGKGFEDRNKQTRKAMKLAGDELSETYLMTP
jgi:hypothetical protein